MADHDLHNAIMNLQVDHERSTEEFRDRRTAYIFGHRDARHAAAELALASPPVAVQEERDAWQDIATAPVGKEMFVAVAIEVMNGHTGGRAYTSDPWCIWQSEKGVFSRWPHNFAPTHWVRLPDVRPARRAQIIAGLQQQALSMLDDMSAAMKGDQP